MKNRNSLIILAVLLVFLAVVITAAKSASPKVVSIPLSKMTDAKMIWHPTAAPSAEVSYTKTLKQLEEMSDAIVLGHFSDDTLVYFTGNSSLTTYFDFVVEDVFKGSLKSGDKIKLSQPYHFDFGNDEEYVAVCVYPYFPSEIGRQYLFFLKYFEIDKCWYPAASYKGRYELPDTDQYPDTTLRQRIYDLRIKGYGALCDEVYKKYFP